MSSVSEIVNEFNLLEEQRAELEEVKILQVSTVDLNLILNLTEPQAFTECFLYIVEIGDFRMQRS